jgi:hypothetical protein
MNGGRKKWLTEMMVDDSKFLITHCHMWRPHQPYLVRFEVSARPENPTHYNGSWPGWDKPAGARLKEAPR